MMTAKEWRKQTIEEEISYKEEEYALLDSELQELYAELAELENEEQS